MGEENLLGEARMLSWRMYEHTSMRQQSYETQLEIAEGCTGSSPSQL